MGSEGANGMRPISHPQSSTSGRNPRSNGYGVGLPLPCASTGHSGGSLLNSLDGLGGLAERGDDNALTSSDLLLA